MSAFAAAPAQPAAAATNTWRSVVVDRTNQGDNEHAVDLLLHARASGVIGIRCLVDASGRLVILLVACQEAEGHPATVYVVDLQGDADPFANDRQALLQLRALLAAPAPLKLLHNAQQDVPPLAAWVGGPVQHLLDTLVLQALQPMDPGHPPPAPPAPLGALLAYNELEPPGFNPSLVAELRQNPTLLAVTRPIPRMWRTHFAAEASALIPLADALYSALLPDLPTHLAAAPPCLGPHVKLLSQSFADWQPKLADLLIGEKQAGALPAAYQLSSSRRGRLGPVPKIAQRPTYRLHMDDRHRPSLSIFCPSLARGWLQADAAAEGQGFQWELDEDEDGASGAESDGEEEDVFSTDSEAEGGVGDPELDESPEERLSRRLGEVQGVDPDLAAVLRVMPRRVAEGVLEVLQCRPGLKPSMVVEIKADYDLPIQVRLISGENLSLNIRADIRELLAALDAARALLEQEAPAGLGLARPTRPPPQQPPHQQAQAPADPATDEWGDGWAPAPQAGSSNQSSWPTLPEMPPHPQPTPLPAAPSNSPPPTPQTTQPPPVQLPPAEGDYPYHPPDPFIRKDNRLAFPGTLHRISCMRHGTSGQVIGLTYRVGRYVEGVGEIFRDLLARICTHPVAAPHVDPMAFLLDDDPGADSGQGAMLILGAPGCGKTTILRDLARIAANVLHKNVIIVDTSNEIAGDGLKPHPCIGDSRRMMVPERDLQHKVMEEAVQNHTPEVVIIDEISNRQEVAAVRTIVQRGISMIATAHGQTLSSLLKNPTLSPLVGGVKEVTLGDTEARRQRVSKNRHERAGPPAFNILVEVLERNRFRVHLDVAESVDRALRGFQPHTQLRSYAPDGTMLLQFPTTASVAAQLPGFQTQQGAQPARASAYHKALAKQRAFLLSLLYSASLPIRDQGPPPATRQPTPPEALA